MASQQLEIELKLEVNPRDASRLQASLPETLARGDRQVLDSIYFDTDKQELRKAGFSLRIRRIGTRHVQTLKADSRAGAGLFARDEWERDIRGHRPVLDDEVAMLRPFVSSQALARLRPVFRTVVQRTVLNATGGGSQVEIAIDQGDIRSGRRKRPICEVELELKQGQPALLFELARQINAIAPTQIGVQSKSERGYNLAGSQQACAIKAGPVPLTAEMTSADALQSIAQSCIRHFRMNEAIFSTRDDADALHQCRVALRRLRSALTLFKPMLRDERYEALRAEVKWMAATLGVARNIDVFTDNLKDQPIPRTLRSARKDSYAKARAALDSPRWREFMLEFVEWLAIDSWSTQPDDVSLLKEPIKHRATYILDRFLKRLKRRGRHLATLDDQARHRVRVEAKKLRYAAEFFAALFSGKAEKRRKAFGQAIEAMLDSLGELNDLTIASTLRSDLALPQDDAQTRRMRKRLLKKAARQYDTLLDLKPFWR